MALSQIKQKAKIHGIRLVDNGKRPTNNIVTDEPRFWLEFEGTNAAMELGQSTYASDYVSELEEDLNEVISFL